MGLWTPPTVWAGDLSFWRQGLWAKGTFQFQAKISRREKLPSQKLDLVPRRGIGDAWLSNQETAGDHPGQLSLLAQHGCPPKILDLLGIPPFSKSGFKVVHFGRDFGLHIFKISRCACYHSKVEGQSFPTRYRRQKIPSFGRGKNPNFFYFKKICGKKIQNFEKLI